MSMRRRGEKVGDDAGRTEIRKRWSDFRRVRYIGIGGIMRILIIGGKGTIGSKVSDFLSKKHDVLIGGRSSGDVAVDIADCGSIQAMFEEVGGIDAVVCTAGRAIWAPFDSLSEEDYYVGVRSKLMGQVNLVRIGRKYLNAGGSFTLTTGILADHPVLQTTSAALVNGGIHGFVRAVSQEMKQSFRINVVSPGLVEDSAEKYGTYFPGHTPIPMRKVVEGYVKSIEGKGTGEIIRIYE
jgi:NAD(P)-dependent dehydrogenase (short-subunit alcohol dehydrogenase family)